MFRITKMLGLIDEAEQIVEDNPKSAVTLIRQFWELVVDDLSEELSLDFKHDRDARSRGKIAKHFRLKEKELARAHILHLQEIGNVAAHFNDPQVSREDAVYSIYVAKQILMDVSDSDEKIFHAELISNPIDAVGCSYCNAEKGEKCKSKEGYDVDLHVDRKRVFSTYQAKFEGN